MSELTSHIQSAWPNRRAPPPLPMISQWFISKAAVFGLFYHSIKGKRANIFTILFSQARPSPYLLPNQADLIRKQKLFPLRLSKIGLIPARKWKRMNQESTPPFWGVFREVFGVRSKIWALKVPFFGTWKRALLHFWSAKKWHFQRPNDLRNTLLCITFRLGLWICAFGPAFLPLYLYFALAWLAYLQRKVISYQKSKGPPSPKI